MWHPRGCLALLRREKTTKISVCPVFFLRLQRPSGLCEKTSHKDAPLTGSLLRLNKLLLLIGSLQGLGVHSMGCCSVLCSVLGVFWISNHPRYSSILESRVALQRSTQNDPCVSQHGASEHTDGRQRLSRAGPQAGVSWGDVCRKTTRVCSIWTQHQHVSSTWADLRFCLSPQTTIKSDFRLDVWMCHQGEHFAVQLNVPWGVSLED